MQAIAAQNRAAAVADELIISVFSSLDAVEETWQALEAAHVQFPSQKLGVVRAWIASLGIAAEDCLFITAHSGSQPILLLPLWRKKVLGARIATWFTGCHFGSYAPLASKPLLRSMSPAGRVELWRRVLKYVPGADLIYLRDIPADLAAELGLDQAMVESANADCVHVAQYPGWEVCDGARRDKRRRKVDRQQGAKLEALGEVRFEVVTRGQQVDGIIADMFAQKAARFREQGIRDPFAGEDVQAFYRSMFSEAGGVLHVLRLDGAVVAVRYNLAVGPVLHSLITSMSPDEQVQAGSPGKQNLLRVMQTVFDEGYRAIDMGKGPSEEKRLWCNISLPLANFHYAKTPLGHLVIAGFRAGEQAKSAIKNHSGRFAAFQGLRKQIGARRA